MILHLKTKKPIDLLDSRERETVMEWLNAYPHIQLITRDGSRTYAKAITQASEDILQVDDRWHILYQLFEAVKKTANDVIPIKWEPSQKEQHTAKDASEDIIVLKRDGARIQNEEQRWARIQAVQNLHKQGYSVTAIHKKVQISRSTVYADLRQKERPSHKRDSLYQKYHLLVHSLVRKNQSNRQIEARCRSEGYNRSLSTLNTVIAEARRKARTDAPKSYSFRQKIINIL